MAGRLCPVSGPGQGARRIPGRARGEEEGEKLRRVGILPGEPVGSPGRWTGTECYTAEGRWDILSDAGLDSTAGRAVSSAKPASGSPPNED